MDIESVFVNDFRISVIKELKRINEGIVVRKWI